MEVFASPWGQSTRPVRYPRIVRPKGQNTILEEQKRGLSCEECGKKLKQITWMHLRKHELTVDQYKEKYHSLTIKVLVLNQPNRKNEID